ncbi:unnamed protein product [Cyclocybe aegerita]|uniref:Uncharacterized protein n=1 Tax=Cyclocybe aegerita TaxID=1973307 RepID=A0A8S0W2U3_CYCAE|nr:unnamed protein product [Cyclocybe aegerita]
MGHSVSLNKSWTRSRGKDVCGGGETQHAPLKLQTKEQIAARHTVTLTPVPTSKLKYTTEHSLPTDSMDAREDLPRISVDSALDWQKVRSNYTDATFAALQAQVASRGQSREHDAIRAHLEQVCISGKLTISTYNSTTFKFIDRTFALAQPNLRVNGHNFESFDENGREMEPFDEILDRRIWSLADTRLQWHKRIAETRRTIPSEIESAISTLMQEHRDLDTIILPPANEEEQQEQSPEDDGKTPSLLF